MDRPTHPWLRGLRRNYGWLMVTAAPVFLGMGSGGIVSITVFLKPLSAEFGWARGEVSLAYLAATLASGVSGIAMGYLADRYSVRPVVWLGSAALGLSYLLLSQQSALWQFILYSAMVGGLANAAFLAPLLAAVGRWFDGNRGLALGLTTAGHAIGQAAIVIVARWLIAEYGWREAYLVLGLLAWAVLLPLAYVVRDAPAFNAPAPDGGASAAKAARSAAAAPAPLPLAVLVGWLSLAMLLCSLCMAMPLVHGVALATDRGVDASAAAGMLVAMMAAGCVARIVLGRLADTIGCLPTWLLAATAQAALVYGFLLPSTAPQFYALALPFGAAAGAVMPALACTVRELVPAGRQAMAMGMVTLFGSVGMGGGGMIAGVLFDRVGHYGDTFALAALAGLGSVLVLGALFLWLHHDRLSARLDWPLEPLPGNGRLLAA